ncbi:MAG TPA: NAD-dependent epimerase/dehydratase family protein, partial [Bacteriovoracaceae bacterium]|nr:NAD-dependent epimerase/dehydratase family protein [Bacteriovoracaceae bacterium]
MSSNEIVIITGSSGYIGSALTKKLSANFKIIGLDRDIPDKRVEGVDYYALDFSSSDELYEVIKGLRQKFGASIKSVVHLVAYYSFSGEESDLYQKITVEGSGNLLRI